MRKLFALILAALLAASLAVNAAACTPRLKIPKVPRFPTSSWNPSWTKIWKRPLTIRWRIM